MVNRVLFKSLSDEWHTPTSVYDALNAEFGFVDDPCLMGGVWDGLYRDWKSPVFCNPPYSRIRQWVEKAYSEAQLGKTVVMLIPSRTDTRWWHDYVMRANEIRFIRGRLRFGGARHNAPFPSCVVVFLHTAAERAQSKMAI